MTNDRAPRRWRTALVTSAVLVVGLLGGFALARTQAGPAGAQPADATPTSEPAPAPGPVSLADGLTDLDPADDTSARAAALAFLEAEAARDFAASFALLSAADQEAEAPVAHWRQRHADLPPIEGFDVTAVGRRGEDVVAVAGLELRSSLDEFAGLVPARAEGSFVLAEEDGGWRVRFADSTIVPHYPDDADATSAAAAWAAAQQRCEEPAGPYDGPQYGVPALATALCGIDADVAVGDPSDLPDGDEAAPFVAAFGPEVFGWARVVPVTGPTPLRVVLAPVDDTWTVIGVLRAAA